MQSLIQLGRHILLATLFCGGIWAAAEGASGRVPSVAQARALLASEGYDPASTTLVLVWTELARSSEAHYVTGYRVQPVGGGASFDLYSSGGRLLSVAERAVLGISEKNWNPGSVSKAAQRPGAAKRRTTQVPSARALAVSGQPAPRLSLPRVDLDAIRKEDAAGISTGGKGVRRIGVFQDFGAAVQLRGTAQSQGTWSTLGNGDRLWSLELYSPGAVGQRIEFSELRLPEGAYVVVVNGEDANEAYGPFTEIHWRDEVLWTPTCYGEAVVVQCVVPALADISEVAIGIERIVHLYERVDAGALAKAAGACNLDVSCYPGWSETASGVAGLGTIGNSGALFCTGSLLAVADECSDVPFVLTANHCVGEQGGAGSLEFYWLYETASCDGVPPLPSSVPRTFGGADYLAGMGGRGDLGGGNDFTLMRMRNDPPDSLGKLGWATAAPALGTSVTGIHHPRGDFKRISFGALTETENTYSDWYHEVTWGEGTTEPGSSGSPVMIAGTQQIIGQLWGGGASCLDPLAPDYYGRFDLTYTIVQSYIDTVVQSLIRFAEPVYTVSEGDSEAVVGVELNREDFEGIASVDYEVVGGSAVGGEDFTLVSGTLLFGVSESTGVIVIPLLPDTTHEVTESFVVTLSNAIPCLASGGDGSTAIVEIVDDDVDTDGDGLSDFDEINGVFGFFTDPNVADSDGDGLSDFDEVTDAFGFITDPNDIDTDGDGHSDLLEISFGLDPTDAGDGGAISSLRVPFFEEWPVGEQ